MTAEIPKQPGRVPVGELRDLVEEWREDVTIKAEISSDDKKPDLWGEVGVLEMKADELETVIERYE